MKTDFETLKALAVYTLNHLTEQKLVEYPIDQRLDLIDKLATELGVSFATDEDIRTARTMERTRAPPFTPIPRSLASKGRDGFFSATRAAL